MEPKFKVVMLMPDKQLVIVSTKWIVKGKNKNANVWWPGDNNTRHFAKCHRDPGSSGRSFPVNLLGEKKPAGMTSILTHPYWKRAMWKRYPQKELKRGLGRLRIKLVYLSS